MKRLFIVLLTALLLLGLCACGDTGTNGDTTAAPDAQEGLLAGYGRGDITPEGVVGMGGYGDTSTRKSEGLLSYIYADSVAITDGSGNTAIVITVDALGLSKSTCDDIAAKIEQETGVPAGNVFISSNHLHSVPSTTDKAYVATLTKGIVDSAKQAMEDQAPAELYINKAEDTELCFTRHYINNDGGYCGDNFGDHSSGYKGHETDADDTLQLIKFVRKGQTTAAGKEAKDIILANFQGHPHRNVTGANYKKIFANLPGVFRETLAERLDCHVAYITGASGNVNQHSSITEENTTKDYKEQGQKLASFAIQAEDSYTKVDAGAVKVLTQVIACDYNKEDVDKLEQAEEVWSTWQDQGNREKANELCKEYGLNSVFHAGAIRDRINKNGTKDMTVSVLSVGDLSFVAAPYEIFDINALAIKEASEFDMTFILYQCNGSEGYIPAGQCCQTGGYEVDTTLLAPGTAEKLETAFVDMLKQLHAQY